MPPLKISTLGYKVFKMGGVFEQALEFINGIGLRPLREIDTDPTVEFHASELKSLGLD